MTRLSLTIAAVLFTCLFLAPTWADDIPRADPEAVGLSSERLARFSAEMEKGVAAGDFPGVVAAVARNGKIAFFESYGFRDRDAGLPMTDDTIFRIASMTKAITGVAVMILYEEGHFSLHDPISKYIPSFENSVVQVGGVPIPEKQKGKVKRANWTQGDLSRWLEKNWNTLSDEEKKKWTEYYASGGKGKGKSSGSGKDIETVPANSPITIRDLLRHTAGISYNMGDIWSEGDDLGQMIDNLAAQPLKSHPGTRFDYGLSMDVLARLVEVVAEQPFDEFIDERILKPLDMKDTAFYVPQAEAKRLLKMPPTKANDQKFKVASAEDPYLSPPIVLAGGTGLVSTTMDYVRFCMMLLNDGELDGQRILGRKSVELMRVNHMNDVADRSTAKSGLDDFLFGLTFGVHGEPGDRGQLGSAGSYYWAGAYGTAFWIDPQENLIGVFMVNGLRDNEKGSGWHYSQMLEHFTYQAIID